MHSTGTFSDGFQSTSSVWRTTGKGNLAADETGISIHVLRVEDDHDFRDCFPAGYISIHVLRVEDDRFPDR